MNLVTEINNIDQTLTPCNATLPKETILPIVPKQNIQKKLHLEGDSKFKKYELKSRKFSYYLAAFTHSIAALAKVAKINENIQNQLNTFSLGLSKLVHSLAYGSLAIDAFKDERILDSVSKLLDPLMSNFSSIDNINLTKGIAGALGTLDFSQAGQADKVNGRMHNLKKSFEEIIKMAKEIYSTKTFSNERKVFISPEKENGHSLAFAGHLVMLSTCLGLTIKPLEKTMNIFRNLGAIIANTITMYHPDNQKKLSGSLFNVYAAFDSVQKFLPSNMAEVLNNINMAIYNIAIYYYGDLSRKRSDNVFSHY